MISETCLVLVVFISFLVGSSVIHISLIVYQVSELSVSVLVSNPDY
jgi:hypothetical protein